MNFNNLDKVIIISLEHGLQPVPGRLINERTKVHAPMGQSPERAQVTRPERRRGLAPKGGFGI